MLGSLHFKIIVMWLFPHTLFFKVQYFAAGFYGPGRKSSIFSKILCLDYLILCDLCLGKNLKNPVVLIIKHELMSNCMDSRCDELREKTNKPVCYCLTLQTHHRMFSLVETHAPKLPFIKEQVFFLF